MDGKIGYSEAMKMDWDDLYEANAALDIYIEKLEEARRKGAKK